MRLLELPLQRQELAAELVFMRPLLLQLQLQPVLALAALAQHL